MCILYAVSLRDLIVSLVGKTHSREEGFAKNALIVHVQDNLSSLLGLWSCEETILFKK